LYGAPMPVGAATAAGSFVVTLSATQTAPNGGRLIVLFTKKAPPPNAPVRVDELHPDAVYVTSVDVVAVFPNTTITVPFNAPGFPDRPAQAPPGDYAITAYLDVHRHFAYDGAEPGDLTGPTIHANLAPNAAIALTLDRTIPEQATPQLAPGVTAAVFISPALTRFAGHPVKMRAVVVAPPDASASQKYPTSFMVGGFGATQAGNFRQANRLAADISAGRMPKMFYVLLDPAAPTGHDVFADSDNNGPCGTALTTEFIPYLESQYTGMQGDVHSRFLTGHSSGGWSTLWLQVTYPDVFGGTWSTSPDPVDFHNFTGPNLFAHADMFRKPDGTFYNLVHDRGHDVMSIRDYVALEDIEGKTGGQFRSFDAVFSPRDPNTGLPKELFNHITGAIHPDIARAWERYDIATVLRNNWPTLGPKLAGKLHITVGTADTFHLNEPIELLAKELTTMGSDAKITFIPGRTHFDLYQGGLQQQIANEMIAASKR
jgi:S-formylglutathione hydrolase FrmB